MQREFPNQVIEGLNVGDCGSKDRPVQAVRYPSVLDLTAGGINRRTREALGVAERAIRHQQGLSVASVA